VIALLAGRRFGETFGLVESQMPGIAGDELAASVGSSGSTPPGPSRTHTSSRRRSSTLRRNEARAAGLADLPALQEGAGGVHEEGGLALGDRDPVQVDGACDVEGGARVAEGDSQPGPGRTNPPAAMSDPNVKLGLTET
jgi:hypothetical protein